MRTAPVLLFCVFLLCTKGIVAEQCWQGATFSNTIISPNLKSSSILRVPDVSSLVHCAEACCDLPGCDLAWYFERRCYVLSCQRKENCQPKQRPGTDSYVAFLQRGPAQTLVLQSLVRGQPYPGRWRPLLRPKGAEALKDLGLFDGAHGFGDSALADIDYPEGYQNSEDGDGIRGSSLVGSKAELKESSGYLDWPSVPGREGLNLSESGGSRGEKDSPQDSLQNPTKSSLFLRSSAPGNLDSVPAPPTDSGPTLMSPVSVPEGLSDSDISQNVSYSSLETTPQLQNSSADSTPQSQMGTFPPTENLPPVSDTPASTAISKPGRTLLVSVGEPVEVSLPRNSVELNTSVISEPQSKTSYAYEWSLISYPTGHQGEMEGKHSESVRLSGLSTGLYAVKVCVTGDGAYGEGFVNVTVKAAAHENQPPRAIASPESQEVTLPAGSVFIDGSRSTDDDRVASYHWEEVSSPPRKLKTSADTAILRLSDLEPGNYTFRLTVVDSEGATDSTLATVRAIRPVDLPPVAIAGPNLTLTLPLNHVTLSGSESSDDHPIAAYSWTLLSHSPGRDPTMEGVRTPLLQLSDLHEGVYSFQLTVTDSAGQQASSNVTILVQPEENTGPTAVVGPDRQLTLPVNSTRLVGSGSTDDQGIATFHWEAISGPPEMKIEDADKAVAMATGLGAGSYIFRLTVTDQQGASDSASLTVTVTEAQDLAPVVHAGGSHTLILPNNSLVLRGSVSGADPANMSYLWVRDGQSPAAGDVLYGSERQAFLRLANLVEGTYLFQLCVTDSQRRTSMATATVEVRPDPHRRDEVELELAVAVSQVSQQQRDTVVRQLAALLHALDSDISVRGLHAKSDISTALRFCVRGRDGPMPGPQLTRLLRSLLLRGKADFLLFRTLRVDTTMCLLRCSGHGQCDPFSKRCACEPFWMENPIRRFLGDGVSNCDWSLLYVVLSCFMGVILIMSVTWACVCCCKRISRRRRTKVRKKTKYTILDNMDDQERMELRPKYNLKHRSTEHNSSLMMSESEFDSEQDTIFTRERQDKGKGYSNGTAKNGDAFSYHPVDG
ncbi:dyslexia-associated protein KIAA0319 [Anguilla anguilla]|uniref:dyslexia-associated protein KIAA0319 n=1 Tax=Anguilla anguilla TaxID=7936 RepID=UPI0015A968A9|nr:dyslexia-associated protein KIAA0319 [Anguilla anguilla]